VATNQPPGGDTTESGEPHESRHRPRTGRYQRGERRTHAEPLTASWRLDTSSFRIDPAELAEDPKPKRQRRLGRYGWRVYLIPVLVAVTVLVVVNTALRTGRTTNNGLTTPTTGGPVATERAVVPVDPGTGTAVLPPGSDVPASGSGTWHIVPGNGPIVGRGKHVYRYQVAVEDGIDSAVYGGDDAFASVVQATLSDPRSWIASGTVALQRVGASYPNPDFVVSLTTPNTDHRDDLCGFQIHFEASCWRAGSHRVIINLARWVRGALAFNGDLGLYREYAINHEVGMVLGNHQVGCTGDGGLAPVMMQQTFGVADDYVHDLNQAIPANRDTVPRDGRVCRPNAWPYPQGNSPG
jgi:hypothetical protein